MKNSILKVELEDIPVKKFPARIAFQGKKMKLFTRGNNVTFYEAVRTADKPFFIVALMVKVKCRNKQKEDMYVELLMRVKNNKTIWAFTDFDLALKKCTELFDKHS